ncbi:MAG: hypothetical protein MUP28_02495 [Candidatus Aminicenantes bacterium]|nr:hypothetical protein [Candidatus Aminicenantes bacterium]
MGLASTMGIDLHSATMMVTKAMEGNYTALGRVGIRVSENLTGEQKQASLLDQLIQLYGRSTAETGTFGGALKQLANSWDEVQETVGGAIVKNESFKNAIKDLKAWVDKLATSPDFQLWLNTVIDGMMAAAKFTGKFAGACRDLMMNVFGATKADKEMIAAQVLLNAALDRARAAGHDVDQVQRAIAASAHAAALKINEVGDASKKALTAEQVKAAKEAADAYKKLGDAAADIVAKYNPLLGAMIKLKAEQDTLTKAWKAGAMSAGAYDKAMDANAKAMKNVGLEAGKSAKAQGAMVKAASDIINKYNPMHAAMVKAIDDEKKLDAALKAGVITDKAYAKGLESIHKDLDAAAAAEKAAKTTTSAFASSIQDLVNKLKVTGPGFKTATAGEKMLMAALIMGRISLKQYTALLKQLNAELADTTGTKAWETNTVNAIGAICAAATVAITYIDGMNQQALQRKLAQLDEEYQTELDLINQSVMNEEDKAIAIAALDEEYEAKRSAAQKKAAEKSKKIAIAAAIINTAEAVTAALTMKPWTIYNFVLAALAGAMGAVQIALIKSQPIGAAAGAIFKQKALLMSQATGQEYEVAEGGEAEIVSSPRQLREAIMGKGRGKGPGQQVTLHNHIYIDGKEMKTFITKTIRELSKAELMQIHPRAVRAY